MWDLLKMVVVLAWCSLPASVEAGMIFVSNRADLGANDVVDWGQLSSDPVRISAPAVSVGGESLFVKGGNSESGGAIFSDAAFGLGNLNGANALSVEAQFRSFGASAALDFAFDNPVKAVGTDLAASLFGVDSRSTINMRVFATDGTSETFNVLTSFDFQTRFNGYAGVRSDVADISRIIFWASVVDSQFIRVHGASVTAGPLDLQTASASTTVPEPASLALLSLGAGILSLAAIRRRRLAWGLMP
jgi:hypothetical protein